MEDNRYALQMQDITVEFPGDASVIGQMVNVQITEAHNWGVIGERQK